MKLCSKCGTTKPLLEFKRDKRRLDKHGSICKSCSGLLATAWRKNNAERIREYDAKRDAIRAARVRRINPEQHRKHNKAWELAHPEQVRANWRNKAARKRGAVGKHSASDAARLFKLQKGRCAYCKTSLINAKHLDHIMPLALGGTNWPTNLQWLCPTCNMSKHAKHPITFAQATLGKLL